MDIQVRPVEYREVEAMRELYRHESHCQIRYDSMLARGLADPYLLLAEGRIAGYGAVLNRYDKGRLMEFYVLPSVHSQAASMFRALLAASQATHIAAQTNIPLLLTMLYDCAGNIQEESILFHDASVSHLSCPQGAFRRTTPEDASKLFPHGSEPEGDWGVEIDGALVATGGFLCHYNPPYADLYMEVAESARRQGIGSYLIQEIKRVCYEAGKIPAARCDPANIASRRTLEKAGFLPCGRVLVGAVVSAT
ncbi:MAG: acetyltransferase [Chthonomonadaceae bacterium]|nr:acetyltransferase [Chthonomonadaceae bacterium]